MGCIARENGSEGSGESHIVDLRDFKTTIYKRTLQPGDAMVVPDRKYAHKVTAYEAKDFGQAHRDMLIITFHK